MRFFVVLSGTWRVGTGEKYDLDSTVAVPAGSYVFTTATRLITTVPKMKKR